MHVLNDALRSPASRAKLEKIIEGELPPVYWRLRVEPAFSRALDFLVGESFATWEITKDRTSLRISEDGKEAAEAIENDSDVLIEEREFLRSGAKLVTEGFVHNLLAAGKRLV